MDYKITTPNKNYTGESAGVNFINGEGVSKDGKSVDWFRKKGYLVEPIEPKEPKAPKGAKEPKAPKVGDLDDNSGNSSEEVKA